MIWIKGEGVKQGVEDIISFPHCRKQYADETMKEGEKPSCQSLTILSSHKALVRNTHTLPSSPTLHPQKHKAAATHCNCITSARFTTVDHYKDM